MFSDSPNISIYSILINNLNYTEREREIVEIKYYRVHVV